MVRLLSEGEAGNPGMTVSAERGDKVAGDANGRSRGGSDILCLFLKRAMKPLRPGPEVMGL